MSTSLFAALQQLVAPKSVALPVRRELRPLPADLMARVGGGGTTGQTAFSPKKFW